ncbi:MAG: DUF2214 family protein [Kofleriaceae bacterium]|nr:DUF2214 family protein [Kofleriaceae bacterium]
MEPAIASALHVLAVAVAVASVTARERAMRLAQRDGSLEPIFAADNWSGIAAMLLMGTGFWRLLGGLAKPTGWYLEEYTFHVKMALLGLGWACEMLPMVTFIRWRYAVKRGEQPDRRRLGLLRVLNLAELGILIAIVFVAALMARGMWHEPASSPACAIENAFATRCLTCHGDAAPQGGLVLAGDPHRALVGVPSATWPDQLRVAPGDPDRSLLWRKLAGTQGPHGQPMPLGQPPDPTLAAQVATWIRAGAPACRR